MFKRLFNFQTNPCDAFALRSNLRTTFVRPMPKLELLDISLNTNRPSTDSFSSDSSATENPFVSSPIDLWKSQSSRKSISTSNGLWRIFRPENVNRPQIFLSNYKIKFLFVLSYFP